MSIEFFAAKKDFEAVLAIVFAERELRVFEAYSSFGARCREFRNVTDVRAAYPRFVDGRCSMHFMLWAPATCTMTRKRIALDPKKCGGHAFRYAIEGWGLIQLLFGDDRASAITPTRLSHNTQKRAANWGHGRDGIDFDSIARISKRFSGALKKIAATTCHIPRERRGARLVLPEAARRAREGRPLKFLATAPWSYVLAP